MGHAGGYLSIFFNKVRIFRFSLDQYFVFVLIVRYVDGPPFQAFIGPVFRFTTPEHLPIPRLEYEFFLPFVVGAAVVSGFAGGVSIAFELEVVHLLWNLVELLCYPMSSLLLF